MDTTTEENMRDATDQNMSFSNLSIHDMSVQDNAEVQDGIHDMLVQDNAEVQDGTSVHMGHTATTPETNMEQTIQEMSIDNPDLIHYQLVFELDENGHGYELNEEPIGHHNDSLCIRGVNSTLSPAPIDLARERIVVDGTVVFHHPPFVFLNPNMDQDFPEFLLKIIPLDYRTGEELRLTRRQLAMEFPIGYKVPILAKIFGIKERYASFMEYTLIYKRYGPSQTDTLAQGEFKSLQWSMTRHFTRKTRGQNFVN